MEHFLKGIAFFYFSIFFFHFSFFKNQNVPLCVVQARLCLCRDELRYAFLPSIMGLSMKIFYRLSEIRCGFFIYKEIGRSRKEGFVCKYGKGK